MKATITYKVDQIGHPWDEKRRQSGEVVWCLIKVITPEYGDSKQEPVALFNLDSEAIMFQGHVFASGHNGSLVKIASNIKRMCEEGDGLIRNDL